MVTALFPRPRTTRQIIGDHGEARALAYLERHGMTVVARNYRCRRGEIDLIMQDGETLVFVEVRQRGRMFHGGAAASITPAKKEKLVLTAQLYLQRYRVPPACRFDVIAIDGNDIAWIRDAISAG
jgi:putative endonuclease